VTTIRRLLAPFIAIGLLTGMTLTGAGSALAQKRVALVIGNSAYQNVSSLPNPANDAAAVATLFKSAGFNVVEARRDLGNLDFKRAIRDFSAMARDAEVAVVFFAGHGIEVRGTNYLLPVDAKLASDFDVEDEAVSLDRVLQALEPAKRLRLVILDACRDNPFLKTMQRTIATRAVSRGLARVEPTSTDTLIAFAAKAGSTAEDGSGANSPFTSALVKHIAVPGLDIRLAFGRVRDDVLKNTSNRQEPFVYGSLGGATLALVSAAAQPLAETSPPQAPSAASTSDTAVRRDYELAERVGTREAWDSFLAVHSSGFFAELARAQRAKLDALAPAKRGDAPVVAVAPTATPEPAKPTTAPGPSPAEITKLLQSELKRVGCITGALDGEWGGASRRAMTAFNRYAKTKFDVYVASIDALDAVRAKPSRVCPLECERGFRAEGERCVEIPKTAAKPPEPQPRSSNRPQPQAPAATAPPSGGGQRIACDNFGCKSVPRNCRVESTFDDRFGSQQRVICP
jgi:uncharacterized caspase-like protein